MPKSFEAKQNYHFKASPAKVFQGLTEPKHLVKWFLSGAKLTPRKGGAFEFDWIGGYHMNGTVLEFTPNKSVSFLWSDKLPNGPVVETTVSFRVSRKGRGTLLTLRHSGFTDPGHYAECASRWAYYLMNMKSVLDHGTELRSELDW